MIKAYAIKSAYALLFALCAAVMLCVLTAALVLIPFGVFAAIMGGLLLAFDFPFIITDFPPVLMLFGGLTAAFAAAFFGFLAVKLGLLMGRLWLFVRKRCEKIGGCCF